MTSQKLKAKSQNVAFLTSGFWLVTSNLLAPPRNGGVRQSIRLAD
jgi:hypothetical protein